MAEPTRSSQAQQLLSDADQPEFVGNRCVHMHIAHASCRACVEVCPRRALTLGEDALKLDADLCDGCGVCAAACPQEAISLSLGPEAGVTRKGARAFLACEEARVGNAANRVPCLHALGWPALVRLFAGGMRELVVTHGDCDHCPRGNAPPYAQALKHANDLLHSRGLPTINLSVLPSDQWQPQARLSSRAQAVSPRRRAFLRRLVDAEQDKRANESAEPPVGLLGTGDLRAAVFPAVPVIDPQRCDGCDACVRMCPAAALAQEPFGASFRYRIDASRCSGCGICVDVCSPRAISVLRWTPAQQGTIDLHTAHCPACGVTYHAPRLRPDRYCRVCATTNHSRKLFQRDPT